MRFENSEYMFVAYCLEDLPMNDVYDPTTGKLLIKFGNPNSEDVKVAFRIGVKNDQS